MAEPVLPGWEFNPTDDVLIEHYLQLKVLGKPIPYPGVDDVDHFDQHPKDLFETDAADHKVYFFARRNLEKILTWTHEVQGYYWKDAQEYEYVNDADGLIIGRRVTLAFHLVNETPSIYKMHMYNLAGDDLMDKDSWCLCKVFRDELQSTSTDSTEGEAAWTSSAEHTEISDDGGAFQHLPVNGHDHGGQLQPGENGFTHHQHDPVHGQNGHHHPMPSYHPQVRENGFTHHQHDPVHGQNGHHHPMPTYNLQLEENGFNHHPMPTYNLQLEENVFNHHQHDPVHAQIGHHHPMPTYHSAMRLVGDVIYHPQDGYLLHIWPNRFFRLDFQGLGTLNPPGNAHYRPWGARPRG